MVLQIVVYMYYCVDLATPWTRSSVTQALVLVPGTDWWLMLANGCKTRLVVVDHLALRHRLIHVDGGLTSMLYGALYTVADTWGDMMEERKGGVMEGIKMRTEAKGRKEWGRNKGSGRRVFGMLITVP